MKLSLTTAVIGLLLPLAMAKSVIVSYPKATPDSIIEDAKKLILDKGGRITQEYSIFKGFAAEVPDEILNSVKTQGGEHIANIEDDSVITIAE